MLPISLILGFCSEVNGESPEEKTEAVIVANGLSNAVQQAEEQHQQQPYQPQDQQQLPPVVTNSSEGDVEPCWVY